MEAKCPEKTLTSLIKAYLPNQSEKNAWPLKNLRTSYKKHGLMDPQSALKFNGFAECPEVYWAAECPEV